MVSLTISYNRYISHIPGYQVVEFDFAGVFMSRDIGLQPSPSRPISVYTYCLNVVTSSDIHFHGSLPPYDCVFLHKTSIGCIMHIIGYNDANCDGEVGILG